VSVRAGRVRLLETGAVSAAIAASICCAGPLALALLGLGGGAVFLRFAPLRPYFIGATLLFLGAAFYFAYRQPGSADCETDASCASPVSRRSQKAALWVVTLVVVLAATFPTWSGLLFH